jgi:malonyl-CoA O-methyltransferase
MDSVFLRREIALRMHERLALVRLMPQQVLDAGCGDAPDLLALQKCYAGAQIVGLDASLGMLKAAQKNHLVAGSAVSRLLKKIVPTKSVRERVSNLGFVCGNFAQLPFAPNKFDLVWSNLALHWHPQPDQVFSEWRRVLRVDGLLMFSCFGPDTFKELRTAFATLDGSPHALPFVDMHDFGDMLVDAGFSTPVMDMETITVTYESVDKLLADVRACGGNPLATRRRSLVTGATWKRVVEGLERMRGSDGKIPLTFEVIYGHAFKPVPRVTSQGEAIVRLDLKKK